MNRSIALTVTLEIVPPFTFRPQRLNFDRKLFKDMTPLTLTGSGDQLATIKILSSNIYDPEHADYYSISFEEKGVGDDRLLLFTVAPNEQIPTGRFNDTLIIYTDHPDYETVRIPISGEILGPIDILPPTLSLKSPDKESPYFGTVRLISTEGKPLSILSTQCSDPRIKITVSETEEGDILIEGHLLEEVIEKRFKAELEIQTNLPEKPIVTVPVYVQKRKR